MKSLLLTSAISLASMSAYAVPPAKEILHSDFENRRSLKNWDLKRLVDDHSIRISSEEVRSGKRALRFELRANDHVSDGFRSEIRDPYFAPMGKTTWYFFSFFVPYNFPIAQSNSCVFAQWHDQKDPGDLDRNPPIAIRIRGTGEMHITGRHHARKIQNGAKNPELKLYEDKKFQRNQWNDILMEVKWSFKKDGLVRIWRNNKMIVNYSGPIGYNDDFGPYLKLGVYCRETPLYPLVGYHDNYRRASNFQDLKLRAKK